MTKCPWQSQVPEKGAGWAERDLKVPFDVALPLNDTEPSALSRLPPK